MPLLNPYTVTGGIFAGSYGYSLAGSTGAERGSTPLASSQNKAIIQSSQFSSDRYIGGATSLLGGGAIGALTLGVAGAALGAGAVRGARMFSTGRQFVDRSIEVGKDAGPIRGLAQGVSFGEMTMMGGASIGAGVGLAAGGFMGTNIYDRAALSLTHNYLDSAGGSDVRGATAMQGAPSIAGAGLVAGLGAGAFGLQRLGAGALKSYMGSSGIKNAWAQRSASMLSSKAAGLALGGAAALSAQSKMNAINKSPAESRINGLSY
jgi:hypothetical protein